MRYSIPYHFTGETHHNGKYFKRYSCFDFKHPCNFSKSRTRRVKQVNPPRWKRVNVFEHSSLSIQLVDFVVDVHEHVIPKSGQEGRRRLKHFILYSLWGLG